MSKLAYNDKDKFVIQFTGLKLGEHQYSFDIDKSLFEGMDTLEILDFSAKADVLMQKQNSMLTFDIKVKGSLETLCDRCNQPLQVDVDGEGTVYFKFGLEFVEESEDVFIIPETEIEVDLEPFITDITVLSIPTRNVHDEADCDPEVIAYLNASEEIEEEEEEQEEEIDPRWSKLKDIKLK